MWCGLAESLFHLVGESDRNVTVLIQFGNCMILSEYYNIPSVKHCTVTTEKCQSILQIKSDSHKYSCKVLITDSLVLENKF